VSLPESADPAAADLDRSQLAHIDRHIRGYVDSGRFPGAHILIARGTDVGHFSCFGKRDIERDLPMTEDTIFRIYSMSKPITSVALMQLYEQGLFQLDDPVHKYIPAWKDLRVFVNGNHPVWETRPCARPMTMRDLLSHQSGLTYGFNNRGNVDAAYRALGVEGSNSDTTLEIMAETLAGIPLEFSPGDRWNYSVSTDVCGYLVQIISGLPFDEYLSRNIFQPLGMADTGFTVPPEKVSRFAANYRPGANGLELVDDPTISKYAGDVTFLSGGGGLVSTTADYLRFCQALLGDGTREGVRILGRKTIELMTSNHLHEGRDLAAHALGRWSESAFAGVGFGLGFSVTLDPATSQVSGTPGEFAWGGAASTAFWIDPAEDLIVIFMTQLMPSSYYNIRRELRAMVYAALG